MSNVTYPKARVGTDIRMAVKLVDSSVDIDWTTVEEIYAYLYSDQQRVMLGTVEVSVNGSDHTKLDATYRATGAEFLGLTRLVLSCEYLGSQATYDAPIVEFVATTAELGSGDITSASSATAVNISVSSISSSLIQEALAACIAATAQAQAAATDMIGATSSANGRHGLVPAPQIADRQKFLRGDGTWQNAGSGTWGNIGGTLSDQTDLQAALDAKGTYSKPSEGIPATDLVSSVQSSLGKADSALQEHQSLAAYRTATEQDAIHDATKQDVIDARHKISADNVDDSDTSNKFVTAADKSAWNAKGTYTKPASGIPASDLAPGVIPDVSGKADKVTGSHTNEIAILDSAGNLQAGDKTIADLEEMEVVTSAPASGGFLPRKAYYLDMSEGGSLDFSLAAGMSGRMSEYVIFIKTGSTLPTITWTGLTEQGVTTIFSEPTIATNKLYELNFVRVTSNIIGYCKEN